MMVFCGVYKKGARFFVDENVKKSDGTVISFAMVPSRRNPRRNGTVAKGKGYFAECGLRKVVNG